MVLQKTRQTTRPLGPSDLRFYRALGIVVLAIGAILVYSLAFSSFDERVRFQWNVTPDGGRTPMISVTCPSPWAVLVHDAEPEATTTEGLCVMPSRALAVEAAGVAVLALILAVWFFTRTKRPGPLHRCRYHEIAKNGA